MKTLDTYLVVFADDDDDLLQDQSMTKVLIILPLCSIFIYFDLMRLFLYLCWISYFRFGQSILIKFLYLDYGGDKNRKAKIKGREDPCI
jgi:membrane protein insertase Oxa1/YidC/SpoIIIJ